MNAKLVTRNLRNRKTVRYLFGRKGRWTFPRMCVGMSAEEILQEYSEG